MNSIDFYKFSSISTRTEVKTMKRNLLRIAFLTSAAGLALAAGSCGAHKDHNHPGQAAQPESPTTGAKPTDGPATGTTNQPADGSITSGGGYVYGYEANPWFIGNIATVRYCVDMDEANFGTSRETAEKAIESAIGLWKDALKNAEFGHHQEEPLGTLVLGTQDFVKYDCAADGIDIRFQMGKLSPDQTRKLGNPVKYVASAVQTSYDEENMRGAGFIYVAPQRGALKPDADDVAENFWTVVEGFNLEVVLVHELGHVFGLPHSEDSIMGASVCEETITNKNSNSWEQLRPFIESGRFGGSFHNFLKGLVGNEFKLTSGELGASPDTVKTTLGVTFESTPEENSASLVLEDKKLIIYSMHQEMESPYVSTRKRVLSTFELTREETKHRTLSSIRIPRKQKIMRIPPDAFSDENYPGGNYQSLNLLMRSDLSISGYVIDPVTNNKTFVTVETQTDFGGFNAQIKVDAVVNGRIEHVGY